MPAQLPVTESRRRASTKQAKNQKEKRKREIILSLLQLQCHEMSEQTVTVFCISMEPEKKNYFKKPTTPTREESLGEGPSTFNEKLFSHVVIDLTQRRGQK